MYFYISFSFYVIGKYILTYLLTYLLYTCYETYCLVLKYDESGKSRASRCYNHVKGFQRKMRELKSTTGDDILVELHQNTSPAIVKRWATNTSLFNKTAPISSASTPIASSASSSASPTLTDMTVHSETIVSTPSSKRRRSGKANDSNICRKCFVKYGSATDNKYNSIWINCAQRRCDYWVHVYCVNLVVTEGKEDDFDSIVKYFCASHNPKALPRSGSTSLQRKK